MTKIHPSIASQRSDAEIDIDARVPEGQLPGAADTPVAAPREGVRIRYGYWLGAIVAGLGLWALAFALLL